MAQATPSPIPDHPSQDTPIEIYGYVTDPKLVGYQILTNYESTYWRALVGKDAWSLYEVLRSFCHEGNNTCNPSLKTLMAILGLTDRRQLIGRVDTKPGKEREIPGLIDALQDYKLAYAEMKGEGPKLRYVFHVNLHPPALTQEQLQQLPKPLQRKHDDLLQRVTKSVSRLDDIEQTKSIKAKKTLASTDEKEGGGTVPPPLVQYHPPPGTVPPKQHPYNTTHRTTTKNKKKNNNSDDNPAQKNVVVALTDLGIKKSTAESLVSRHSQPRIEDHVDLALWAKEQGIIKTNFTGWLIKAIRENYLKQKTYQGFQTRRQQAQAEAAKKRAEEARQRDAEARNRAAEAKYQQHEKERVKQLEKLKAEWGTTKRELELWPQVQDSLRLQMTRTTFEMWLDNSQLLKLNNGTAVIGVANEMAKEWCENRLYNTISRTLGDHLESELPELEFVALE